MDDHISPIIVQNRGNGQLIALQETQICEVYDRYDRKWLWLHADMLKSGDIVISFNDDDWPVIYTVVLGPCDEVVIEE